MANKERASRDEDNRTRKQRLAQIKRGPGVFVYDGSAVDSHWEPTPLRAGRQEPMLDNDGMPVLDAAGRQRHMRVGALLKGKDGRPVMGGEPKKTFIPIETYKIWGSEFPTGEPVEVSDQALARKLRCLGCFDEVEAKAAKAAPAADDGSVAVVAKKPGRKPKAAPAAEALS